MNIEIANRLVNLRKQNNLSQEALAEKLGISRQAVSKWERAEASPDTDNLILLARLYGVSLDELLKTEDEIPMPEEEKEAETEENKEWENSHTYGKTRVVIGLDGIHVQDDDDKIVHIGLDGIHAQNGSKDVHVDWSGIHIDQKPGEHDGEEEDWSGISVYGKRGGDIPHPPRLHFPWGVLAVAAYIYVGVVYQAWHPGWLIFLLIPVPVTFFTAIREQNANVFAYPVLVLDIFLALGFLLGNWMGWLLFLTIPLYYGLVNYIKSLLHYRRWKKQKKEGDYV